MDHRDHRDEFQDWCDMWDDAQKSGIFPDLPPIQPVTSFGIDDPDADDAAAQYYNHLDNMDDLEDGMLQEDDRTTPNPIYPDSVGKDQDFPTAPWTDEDSIKTVADLKRKLYDLECRLNAQDAGGKRWHESPVRVTDQKARTQIESLKRRLDILSDALGVEDEPPQSVWKVRR